MPAEEATPAIVLRNRDYGESDRIVTVLTRDAGKLGGIAKGAKQSRRRFERKLELFSHVMLYFRRRPHGDLVFITRAEAAELTQFELEDDLGKIALGSYMLELADALIREGTDTAEAYRILAGALGALARNGACAALRQAFESTCCDGPATSWSSADAGCARRHRSRRRRDGASFPRAAGSFAGDVATVSTRRARLR